MCMAAVDAGNGACMMEENDGTGEGEWGKLMWVMGTPMDGCPGWVDMAMDASNGGADACMEGIIGGAVETSEMIGPEAGSCGMPP